MPLFVILDAMSDGDERMNLGNVRKLTTKSSQKQTIFADIVSRKKRAKLGCEGDKCK